MKSLKIVLLTIALLAVLHPCLHSIATFTGASHTLTHDQKECAPIYVIGSNIGSAPYYIIGEHEGKYYYLGVIDPRYREGSAWNAARTVLLPQDGLNNIRIYSLTAFPQLGCYKWIGDNAEMHITNPLYRGYKWHVMSSYPVVISGF